MVGFRGSVKNAKIWDLREGGKGEGKMSHFNFSLKPRMFKVQKCLNYPGKGFRPN